MSSKNDSNAINRRQFIRSTAAVGAGLIFSPEIIAQTQAGDKPDDINVAIIGVGDQGRILLESAVKIPGIRFRALCDIWTAYNQQNQSRFLKAYKHEHNVYVDYREMLNEEKDLQAVIIATPDFCHAEQTVACLRAGLHVYCEKEMSNTLEGARQMVLAARETGKLLQIGHQRRSNPRYIYCYEKLLKEASILGRLTTINGQWNRSVAPARGYPQGKGIDEATLNKYGYKSMEQFRDWRWYKGLGGGPIVDLGSHQIDIYNWFLDATPKTVVATGGTDYYDRATHQWYDNVMAVYSYETKNGTVRAFYQTITTNSSQGYFEVFMGDQGTLVISEASYRGQVYREKAAPAWDKWVKRGLVIAPAEKKEEKTEEPAGVLADVRESPKPDEYKLAVEMTEPYHKPHLENFFDAIRGKAKLNCPPDVAYESAITVLKVNEAIEAGCSMEFKPEEFKV
ncbi:MAG: Gfo/Idh/MocA family oxidoreductase [Sedimentisphaerales bacterium]|nr:Gfo/Idh/MocA family oxidoreductase [Sedimentisphaerales bacterium]